MEYKRRKISSCQNCSNEDNLKMVQCDRCDKWSHYDCVGVSDQIENVDWFCPKCEKELGELQFVKEKLSEQEKKYGAALREHENEKKKFDEVIASTQQKLSSLSVDLETQKEKLANSEVGASATSKELRSVSAENGRLSGEVGRLTEMLNAALQEHANERKEFKNAFESTEEKLKILTVAYEKQKEKLTNIEQGAAATSQELKNVHTENAKLTVEVMRLSEILKGGGLPVSSTVSQKTSESYDGLNDEERAAFIYNKLPCLSNRELRQFGSDIINPKDFISMQKMMLLFGGNINKFIASVMYKIIGKELLRDMSLSGNRTSKTEALSDYPTIINLLHTTAKLKFGNYEIESGEKVISNFLKNQ